MGTSSDTWEQFGKLIDRALPHYETLPLFDGRED